MTTSDNETSIIAEIEDLSGHFIKALKSTEYSSRDPDEACHTVRKEVRSLVDKALPNSLPLEAAPPEKEQDCSKYAALSYTLVAEIIHFFLGRKVATTLGRGLVLDLWDMWWSRASGIQLGKEPRVPSSSVAEGRLETGFLIDPVITRSVLTRLDDDIARILEDNVDKHLLKRQGIWLLRRLHHARFPLRQRVVLYEFLRLRHWCEVDRSFDIDLPYDSLELLINAAKESKDSLRRKDKKSMPIVSEDAFQSNSNEIEQEECLMLETLQILRSVAIDSNIKINEIGSHLLEAAGKLGIKTGELSESDVKTLLLRLAASSRMIRSLCSDLLSYNFPKPNRYEPPNISSSAGCDCWVSVIGYRQAGKTTFMRSLVAALLPDGSQFNDPEIDWLMSRASILNKEDFERSPSYAEIFESDNSVKTRLDGEMSKWLNEENKKDPGTKPGSRMIAEIRTQHMARLRFFDLAGEEIFENRLGEMNNRVIELLVARKPVATIYIDAEDTRNAEDDGIKFNLAVEHAFVEKGPIYIVFNKADKLLESYKEEKALEELMDSIGHKGQWDRPQECDADYDPRATNVSERFFSTRWLKLPETGVATHQHILAGVDELPAILRRPFFHDRLRKDIANVKNLIDTLLIKGRRDITFVYLTSACCQRTKAEDLCGTREFWKNIENRVLTSTRNDRIDHLQTLLKTGLKENLKTVAETYEPFDKLFGAVGSSSDSGDSKERLRNLNEILDRDLIKVKKFMKSVPHINTLINQSKKIKDEIRRIECLKVILDECIERFLPELGFLPDNRKSQINITYVDQADPRIKKIREQAQALNITAEDFLKSHKYDFTKGKLRGMIFNALKQVTNLQDTEFRGNRQERGLRRQGEGTFDINQGWQGYIKLGVGSHVHNGDINLAMNEVLSRNVANVILNYDRNLGKPPSKVTNDSSRSKDALPRGTDDWCFRDGLLAENFDQTEKRILADALFNFCHPDEARYPNFVLRHGEQDFYKVRVLMGDDQLATELCKFREESLVVLHRLLSSRYQLNTLKSEAVLDLIMAQKIHNTLSDDNLPSIEELVKNKISFDNLTKTTEALKSLKNAINPKSKFDVLFFFRAKGAYRKFYQGANDETRGILNRINIGPWDLGYEEGSTWNASEVRARKNRIECLSLLYDLLIQKVGYFRGQETVFDTANEYVKDSTLGLDIDLFQKVCRLHIRRMCLVNVYPFYYLSMTRWVEDSIGGKGIKSTLKSGAVQRFKDHPNVLQRLFYDGAIAVYSEFLNVHREALERPYTNPSIKIGSPLDNYQKNWERAESERDKFVEILLDDTNVRDLIWDPGK